MQFPRSHERRASMLFFIFALTGDVGMSTSSMDRLQGRELVQEFVPIHRCFVHLYIYIPGIYIYIYLTFYTKYFGIQVCVLFLGFGFRMMRVRVASSVFVLSSWHKVRLSPYRTDVQYFCYLLLPYSTCVSRMLGLN